MSCHVVRVVGWRIVVNRLGSTQKVANRGHRSPDLGIHLGVYPLSYICRCRSSCIVRRRLRRLGNDRRMVRRCGRAAWETRRPATTSSSAPPPETTTRRKRTPLLLRLSSLSLSLSLSLYARPCVSKKKERESPSALKHTLFPLASSTSSIEKKREGPREREREREGMVELFFSFFLAF